MPQRNLSRLFRARRILTIKSMLVNADAIKIVAGREGRAALHASRRCHLLLPVANL